MTRIRCRDRHCNFNKNGICASEEIEYEPDAGCLTMEPREETNKEKEGWEEEELEDLDDDIEDEEEEDKDWEEEEDDSGFTSRRRKS